MNDYEILVSCNKMNPLCRLLFGIDISNFAMDYYCNKNAHGKYSLSCKNTLEITQLYLNNKDFQSKLDRNLRIIDNYLYDGSCFDLTHGMACVIRVIRYSMRMSNPVLGISSAIENLGILDTTKDKTFIGYLIKNCLGPKKKFNKNWKTSNTKSLAKSIYDDKNYSLMPILADALQDAGCDCDEVLTRLREGKDFGNSDWVLWNLVEFRNPQFKVK